MFSQKAYADYSLKNVELQWAICEPNMKSLWQKIGQHTKKRTREILYSDTPTRALYRRGAILRTKHDHARFKTAAKIKGYSESSIPWDFLSDYEYKCEWDSYSTEEMISCTVYADSKKMNQLHDKAQEEFISRETNFNSFDQVQVWGPLIGHEWSFRHQSINLIIDSIDLPDTAITSIELSARVNIEQKYVVKDKIEDWIKEKNLALCRYQTGRTGVLLKYLIERNKSLGRYEAM